MAYIQPTSEVWLCSNVPLDPSYDNTLTFTTTVNNREVWDSAAQRAYFASKAVYHPQNFSIVKERDGVLRMSGEVSKFYNINYMFFVNPTFEPSQLYSGKYFYAFVTQVQEVNPNTTFIYFELDYYQTWAAEIEFMESVIEREHVSDDSIYKNLEDEGINIQDTMPYEKVYLDKVLGQKILVVGATESYEQLLENMKTKGYDIFYDPWDIHYPILNDNSNYDVFADFSGLKISNLICYDSNNNSLQYSSFTYDEKERKFHIYGLEDVTINKIAFLVQSNPVHVFFQNSDAWYVLGVNNGGDWTFSQNGIRIAYDPWTKYPNKTSGQNYKVTVFNVIHLKNNGNFYTGFFSAYYFNCPGYVGVSPNRIVLSDVSLASGTSREINEIIFEIKFSDGSSYKVNGVYSGGSWTFTDGS